MWETANSIEIAHYFNVEKRTIDKYYSHSFLKDFYRIQYFCEFIILAERKCEYNSYSR